MALDKGTRNIVIVGGIIGLGGLAYWWFTRRSGNEKGLIFATSDLNGDGTKFSILVKQGVDAKELEEGSKKISQGGASGIKKGYPYIKKFNIGDKMKITNGGKMNGVYEITKKWYLDTDPTKTKVVYFDLKNTNWGGWKDITKPTTKKNSYKFWLNAKDFPKWVHIPTKKDAK